MKRDRLLIRTMVSSIHFTEILLHISSPAIPEFHLNFNYLPALLGIPLEGIASIFGLSP
jgi:hypothetical protein